MDTVSNFVYILNYSVDESNLIYIFFSVNVKPSKVTFDYSTFNDTVMIQVDAIEDDIATNNPRQFTVIQSNSPPSQTLSQDVLDEFNSSDF